MLDPEDTWVSEFKKLKPADTPIQGIMNLADVIEKLTNKIEANLPGGQSSGPGIFKWAKPIFIAQCQLPPTPGPTWIPILVAAWTQACSVAVITPGTVQSSTWTVSTKDVNTLPIGAATIPTISAGATAIQGILATMAAQMQADPQSGPKVMAKAFRAGALAFVFTLIGIAGTPISPVPTPLPAPAK